MLKILIIDDEPLARARLNRLLETVPECAVVGEAGSARSALAKMSSLDPDLLLLDISMPGLDGMALARMLSERENPPAVVFCTAWPDQALEAFDCDAVDYLVKPVRHQRLKAALGKVKKMRGRDDAVEAGPFLRSTIGGKTTLIALDKVICLQAEDKYTTLTYDGGRTVINNSLLELERRFPEYLLRVHRNALVARKCIRGLQAVTSGPAYLLLEGTDIRPEVSRRELSKIRSIIREIG